MFKSFNETCCSSDVTVKSFRRIALLINTLAQWQSILPILTAFCEIIKGLTRVATSAACYVLIFSSIDMLAIYLGSQTSGILLALTFEG